MSTTHPIIRDSVNTRQRNQMVDLTDLIDRAVRQKHVTDGYAIVFVPHTTAGVTIQENADPDVQHDLLEKLARVAPKDEDFYQHAEGNSDAHLKTVITGNSVTVLIENGRLVLGRWQAIYFMEFDGPRERRVMIKVVALD